MFHPGSSRFKNNNNPRPQAGSAAFLKNKPKLATATLTRATLTRATLTRATLTRATLTRATLTTATDVYQLSGCH